MGDVAAFLDMGGYARFVWPAYAVSGAVMAGLLVLSWRGLRRRQAELAALQAEAEADDEA